MDLVLEACDAVRPLAKPPPRPRRQKPPRGLCRAGLEGRPLPHPGLATEIDLCQGGSHAAWLLAHRTDQSLRTAVAVAGGLARPVCLPRRCGRAGPGWPDGKPGTPPCRLANPDPLGTRPSRPPPAHRLFPAARLSAFFPARRAEVRRRGRRRATCSPIAYSLRPVSRPFSLLPAPCSLLPVFYIVPRYISFWLLRTPSKQYAVFSRVEKIKSLEINRLPERYSLWLAAKTAPIECLAQGPAPPGLPARPAHSHRPWPKVPTSTRGIPRAA